MFQSELPFPFGPSFWVFFWCELDVFGVLHFPGKKKHACKIPSQAKSHGLEMEQEAMRTKQDGMFSGFEGGNLHYLHDINIYIQSEYLMLFSSANQVRMV